MILISENKGALDDIRRATDIAYKAVAEYGLNQTIGPLSLATLSGGGADEGSGPWGRDQVILTLHSCGNWALFL